MRLLVAEDEKQLNRLITRTLEEAGYSVDSVFDGEAALDYLEAAEYDLAVLDIMMPKLDGIAVLKHYRSRGGKTPALFLTARDGIDDRVQGLDSGADDYIVKPFSFDELLARIRAVVRRSAARADNVLTETDLVLDLSSHRVTRSGREIELSSKEYQILEYLMINKNQVLDREKVRSHIWSWDYDGQSNVVDVYISILRKKIDDGFEPKLIHTVRGSGYILQCRNC